MKKALEPGNIPNSGKLPEKFPSLGSGQIYSSGWWRERSQGDFTNPTTPVLPAKKIQQSSQVEKRNRFCFSKVYLISNMVNMHEIYNYSNT